MNPLIVRFSLALAVASSLRCLALAQPTAAVEKAVRHNSLAAQYTMDVTVDDQRHVVDVRETVDATNRTGVPLTSLIFNVTPRHFSGFAMGPVTVDGVGQQPKFDDVVMEVPLRSPLPPDKSSQAVVSANAEKLAEGPRPARHYDGWPIGTPSASSRASIETDPTR